ncbi:MAG: sulfotransferase [Gammaproteobacteria bacterium]|nr:sulfotransferase [Gammaproteobacteria bacterium]
MNICLIGGSGRSGTTILSKIFALHPDMADVPEWRFLIDPDGIIDFYNSSENWSPYHYNLHLHRLEKQLNKASHTNFFERLLHYFDQLLFKKLNIPIKLSTSYSGVSATSFSPNYNQYSAELINSLSDFEYMADWEGQNFTEHRKQFYKNFSGKEEIAIFLRKFLTNIMVDVTNQQDKEHYLEKNTWNILWFDKILEILPDAKLVHIYRDPRDISVSFSKQLWMPNDVVQCAKICKDIFNQWEEIKKRVPDESYYELSLESLVESSEQKTKDICQFWNIDWDRKLLDIDLSRSNSGRWKSELNQQQKEKVNSILNNTIVRLGYE